MNAEKTRLEEDAKQQKRWRRWGPYVSDRQWGTVREDYSANGEAWTYLSHDQSRSRAYRWGEDGIAGISDNHQRLCFAPAFWNGEDPILKERFFGLNGSEGNHGEDVKEYYFYLDNTPTHSYMKCLYKYPSTRFPYERLAEENRRRGQDVPEFELLDTGVFSEDRYFDIFIEYAKADAEDLLIRIQVFNRGPEERVLHVLPTLWFRNTWSWDPSAKKPQIRETAGILEADIHGLGSYFLASESAGETLFTENETNFKRIFGSENAGLYVKDAFHEYVVDGRRSAVNPGRKGSKAAFHQVIKLKPGASQTLRYRLSQKLPASPFAGFDAMFAKRQEEAERFYEDLIPSGVDEDHQRVQRQAFAGMLWSKQFYHYVIEEWLNGDPAGPVPPQERKSGRNHRWPHFYSDDILSMPDTWEYPWFASWDLAFHCIPLAMIDAEFAKKQLMLLTREWYMHPNGQLPAYEWNFEDVNPPVHAWAAWRVYKIEAKMTGKSDRAFLERVFQKLLLNFTWWVNRKDGDGKNIFEGGFLGLDNISVFNRNDRIDGGHLDQSDATSWMAMYALNMLTIALELARENPVYEDIASKFYEHFLYISEAISHMSDRSIPLWNEGDGFFYDVVHLPHGHSFPLKVRSLVGLIPLLAVETLDPDYLKMFPGFKKRFDWFTQNRKDLCGKVACMMTPGTSGRRLLSIVDGAKLRRVLEKMLDENEFLSSFGIRSVSKVHREHPYTLRWEGVEKCVSYDPGDSTSRLFGGNSNWRGPVWFPVNFLLLEALQKFHYYLGDDFKVECPRGSGIFLNLWEVSQELSRRLTGIFLKNEKGERPVFGGQQVFNQDPNWKNHVLFYEYFHGDTGAGVGASHQTGWTGLVAKLIQQYGEYCCGKNPGTRPEPSKDVVFYSQTKEVNQCGGVSGCGAKETKVTP